MTALTRTTRSTKAAAEALALRAAQLMSEFKGIDIQVLSLAGLTDMTDYFVIASGTSDTHVRSMSCGSCATAASVSRTPKVSNRADGRCWTTPMS